MLPHNIFVKSYVQQHTAFYTLKNGEFRTHIDCCDESGDITDKRAETWYSPDCKSMAGC